MSESLKLLSEVTQALSDTVFEVIRFLFFPEEFGNYVLEFEGSGVQVRITCDRGSLLTEVAPARSDEWVFLARLLRVKGVTAHDVGYSLDSELRQVLTHFGIVQAALSPADWHEVRQRVRRLARSEVDEWVGGDTLL